MANGTKAASAAIKAMMDAAEPPPLPPKHMKLKDRDIPFWDNIVRSRARADWAASDLIVAVQLARTMASIEEEQARLDAEGSVIENARGTPVMNPRHTVLEGLARKELALMRALRMAGLPTKQAELVPKQRLQRAAEAARADLMDDELLA